MDPDKFRQHNFMLYLGYALIGLAVLMISIILLFVAYGFGYKNGEVIQSGLVFLSSQPNPANIFIDGKNSNKKTNSHMVLPAGTYNIELQRAGYNSWARTITVNGGDVAHYDYPFLFPSVLKTTSIHDYASAPAFTTQSPDHRWLIISSSASLTSFDQYDLNNPKNAPTVLTLPVGLLTTSTAVQSMKVVEWSFDNTHVLLQHTYDNGSSEYILMDRSAPEKSVNLTRTLTLPTSGITLELSNKRYDKYLVFNSTTQVLSRTSLSTPQLTTYLENVIAYKTYGNNTVLYATPSPTDPAKVNIDIYDGSDVYTIRVVHAGTTYLLDLTSYSGSMYAVVAASSENIAYVFKDPIAQLSDPNIAMAVPVSIIRLKAPSYVSFSVNAQFVVVENSNNFAVYDAENKRAFVYTLSNELDKPQTHASWMDGDRLMYVSGGKLLVYDYDGINKQTLVTANPSYIPSFDSNFRFLYTMATSPNNQALQSLTSTSMLIPSDQ